jgi:hypothetical protein
MWLTRISGEFIVCPEKTLQAASCTVLIKSWWDIVSSWFAHVGTTHCSASSSRVIALVFASRKFTLVGFKISSLIIVNVL